MQTTHELFLWLIFVLLHGLVRVDLVFIERCIVIVICKCLDNVLLFYWLQFSMDNYLAMNVVANERALLLDDKSWAFYLAWMAVPWLKAVSPPPRTTDTNGQFSKGFYSKSSWEGLEIQLGVLKIEVKAIVYFIYCHSKRKVSTKQNKGSNGEWISKEDLRSFVPAPVTIVPV